MKKFIYSLLLSFNILLIFSQEVKVSQKIEALHLKNKEFTKYSLFSENTKLQKNNIFKKVSPDATILSLHQFKLAQLVKEKPEQLEIDFPYNGKSISVELYKTEISTPEFKAKTHTGEKINYTPGIHYRGIIKGNKNSVVAFSFFKNEIIGVSFSNEFGDIELGKIKNSTNYISYSNQNLQGENPFKCGIEGLPENKDYLAKLNTYKPHNTSYKSTTNCVRIYYEITYKPYVENSSNLESTLNWITSIHNNIATLYANDGINVSLSEILIWTQQDPYTGDAYNKLYKFRNTRTTFNGDLANLIDTPSSTSLAFVNSLCTSYNYAYSGVSLFYEKVPTYSWTILAMTHEMGHTMGSPHTHACAWNGNNTAIDGCAPTYDINYKEGNCPIGPIPKNKGTIMSYCHLLYNIGNGIDLNNGFGPQPSELIRNTIDSKSCLGTNCINNYYCKSTVEKIAIKEITKTSAIINIKDNTSSQWKYRIYPYPTKNNLPFIDTNKKSINIDNLLPNTYYVIEIGNKCENNLIAETQQIMFLTDGDYCNGDIFNAPKEEPNFNFTKTFYPNNPNDKISLTFINNIFFLNDNHLYIYNGENDSYPLFPGGVLTKNIFFQGNIDFTSTAPSGAITVKFETDGETFGGFFKWDAKVSCSKDYYCKNTIEDILIKAITKTSAIVNITDNTSSQWKYKVYPYPTDNNSTFIDTNKKSINIDNLLPNSYYVIEIGNNCENNLVTKTQKIMFLTDGDYCNGDKFNAPKEEPNFNFTKTFYPNNPNDKLSLTFNNNYSLNKNHLYIYNGETDSHPLFNDGILTGNHPINKNFTSTDPSGAITVKFETDEETLGGDFSWNATIFCPKQPEIEDSNSRSIFPNPVKDILYIKSTEGIDKVYLYDLSGKLILAKNYDSIKSLNLKISNITPAIYILVVKYKNKKTFSTKIIKI